AARGVQMPRAGRRNAVLLHGVVPQAVLLAVAVERLGPGLEGSDFRRIREIGEKAIFVHLDLDASLEQSAHARFSPVTRRAGRSIEAHRAVGEARGRPA